MFRAFEVLAHPTSQEDRTLAHRVVDYSNLISKSARLVEGCFASERLDAQVTSTGPVN
jgi:hypothetical protein